MPELILFVVVMVAAGYVLRRSGRVRSESARELNLVVFYVTLPPLIFRAIHGATLRWSVLALPALAWGATAVGLALAALLARAGRLPGDRAGAAALALAFGNTTFFGYPVIHGFYGPAHLVLAVFYDLLGATIAANTVGALVASAAGGRGARLGPLVRRLAVFPPLWALGLGLALRGVPLPPMVDGVLERVGVATVPLIMLSIGLTLRFRDWREDWPLVAAVAVGRLVVVPAVIFVLARALDLPLAWRRVAVLQAAMPTMFFSLTLALLFGLRVPLVVNAIMLTTVASFATLPLWHLAVER